MLRQGDEHECFDFFAPELASLIEAKLQSGRYRSTTEIIREALLLLDRADQAEAEELRRAWEEGIKSGDAGPLDLETSRGVAQQELTANRKG